MEQGARAVADLHEGEMEHGGDVPAPGGGAAGAEGSLAREAASSEQDDISGEDNAGGYGAAGSESDDDEDNEEALTEESEGIVAPAGNAGYEDASSGSAQSEDHEAPAPEENPAVTMARFELRGFRPARRAIAHATPPSSYRLPIRGRKPYNPTRLIDDAADAASGCGNAYYPATSEAASFPATSASLGSPSATSRLAAGVPAMAIAGGHGENNNEPLGSTATRSGSKASDPQRDVSRIHLTRARTPEMDAAAGNHAPAPAPVASYRLPSRSRKRRRPEHYPDTEEAVAAERARARRCDASLDRLITSLACASPSEQQIPAWVTGAAAASGGGPEVTDESARVLAIAAILGAAMALSVVSCVLFYVAGQQTGSGPSDSHKKKVRSKAVSSF
ncbi:unnamed protein product [Urochloa humidicola]